MSEWRSSQKSEPGSLNIPQAAAAADHILLDAKTHSLTLKFNDFGDLSPSPLE